MPKVFLSVPPLYTILGIYRLLHDQKIRDPVWDKLNHGARRGLIVAAAYGVIVFFPQKWFIAFFLSKSPKLSKLMYIPYVTPHFDMATWATLLAVTSQMSDIMRFFLSKNIRIAKDRAWDLTLLSRGKDASFWGPYFEEWKVPPEMKEVKVGEMEKVFGSWWGRFIFNKFILFPLKLYPLAGYAVAAGIRAYGTSRYLHTKYFKAKNMNQNQISVYMEEHKWDYRVFGFTAALFEFIPILGIVFSVSNQIGAAMWAHDLEKRQNRFRKGELLPLPPRLVKLDDGTTVVSRPDGTGLLSAFKGSHTGGADSEEVVGGWKAD